MDSGAQARATASPLRSFLATLKARVQEETPSDAPSSRHFFDSVNMYGNIQGDDVAEDLDEEPDVVPESSPVLDSMEGADMGPLDARYPIRPRKTWYRRLGQFFVKQQDWFFLLVLGLCSAIIALSVEETIIRLYQGTSWFRPAFSQESLRNRDWVSKLSTFQVSIADDYFLCSASQREICSWVLRTTISLGFFCGRFLV